LFTPGRKKTASVTSSKTLKNSGVKISPSFVRAAIRRRFAPPNCSRYSRKVCM